jgi:LmbE family N-acetylglucosaminyl deacetylase
VTERLSGGGQQVRLLGVFAHPDDETFCAGGTFARYAKDGAEIMVVSATRGQAGQIRDSRVATRRTIAAVREAELRQACEQLGVAHVECWGYLDGTLAEADFGGLVGEIVRRIREFRPDVVISFGPDGGYGHPDHITISAAATAACRQAADPASYPAQLAAGLAGHRPARLYHSHCPQHDVLLMDRLASWLTSRQDRFAGTMDFVHSLLLMAAEAGTMGYVRDHAQVHWYPAGCYVVEQGEPSRELFVVLSGHADVWQEQDDGSRTHLRQLGPGEFFGELGVAAGHLRSAHVVATEGLTCLVFSPVAPTLFDGRGEGARLAGRLPGPAGSVTAAPGGGDGAAGAVDGAARPHAATAELDVTAQIEAKIGALCAYRSQFPLEPGMFPAPLLRELFGREYFVQVLPPRPADSKLL